MSLEGLNQYHDDDDEDVLPEEPAQARETARFAILRAAFDQALTRLSRKLLINGTSSVIIVEAPSALWVPQIVSFMGKSVTNLALTGVTEIKKRGSYEASIDPLDGLTTGKTVVVVSQDVTSYVPDAVRTAADCTIAVRPPTAAVMRKAIRSVTGGTARGLVDSDIAGLDFNELVAAVRPNSSATSCVERLRRAAAGKAVARVSSNAPRIEDIPLTANVRSWADDMLMELRAVDAGEIAPAMLRHGVLEGVPGTGKTLVAGALAQSAGWRFVSTSVGTWFARTDGHLGSISKAAATFVDDILSQDRTIGFIDELDAVPNRETLDAKDREWWTPVVTLILLQIDRLRASGKKVLLLSATNYYDRLDGALIRGGRLEQRISVQPPGRRLKSAPYLHTICVVSSEWTLLKPRRTWVSVRRRRRSRHGCVRPGLGPVRTIATFAPRICWRSLHPPIPAVTLTSALRLCMRPATPSSRCGSGSPSTRSPSSPAIPPAASRGRR